MDTASKVAGHLLDLVASTITGNQFSRISIPVATLQALGFATSALLCALVGAMQWQSDRDTRQRTTYALLWSLGGTWSLGSFALRLLRLAEYRDDAFLSRLAAVVAWSVTCISPSVLLYIIHCEFPVRALGRRILLGVSWYIAAALLTLLVLAAFRPAFPLSVATVVVLSFFSSIAHALASGAIFLRRRVRTLPPEPGAKPASRMLGITIALIMLSAAANGVSLYAPRHWVTLRVAGLVIGQQWMLIWTIAIAFYLAETRYADVVLKRGLTIVASVALGAAIAWILPGLGRGLPVVVASLCIAGLILTAPLVTHALSHIVDRWILDRPDYVALANAFADRCRRSVTEDELFRLVANDIHLALRVNARMVGSGDRERHTETLRRLTVSPAHEIVISPTTEGRTLMRSENAYLDAIAAEVSRRLESLRFEHERRERQMREERLTHSLTQAELKALRAQVDPHFLFNTLNAIADLISTDPVKAEAMTERLADFFRYTLSRTERTLTTLDQELGFARQYLDIEQVRFGDRLHVEVSSEPGLGTHTVPALILQPLIENAVRHGLAPKREGGHITVSASRDGDFLQLRVADDGVGMRGDGATGGVGLANVRSGCARCIAITRA
jgi:two-component system, LytTR family, sensor kinase